MGKQNAEDRIKNSESRIQNSEGGESQAAAEGGIDLAAENAALKARIAELESAKNRLDADEVLIAEKMAKGLRREQARAVINRQREFEAKNPAVAKATARQAN